jgi:hypothetical protein
MSASPRRVPPGGPQDEAFPPLVLQAFETVKEVDIETSTKDGKARRTVIWIVVVDGVPYVRSVRGARGKWFGRLMARRTGTIHVGRRRVPVRASRITGTATNAKVSDAIRAKYKTSRASVVAMVRPEVLATTARLEPA